MSVNEINVLIETWMGVDIVVEPIVVPPLLCTAIPQYPLLKDVKKLILILEIISS